MSDRIRDAVNQLHLNTRQAYLKSGNEIISGLERLVIRDMPIEKRFIYYYFACEWMAKIFYGLSVNKSISKLKNTHKFYIKWIRKARQNLELSITPEELNALFNTNNKNSARNIRNRIAHNFAESTLQEIAECGTEHIPVFKKLLNEWEAVSARLK